MNTQALAIQPPPEPEPEKTGFLDRTLRKLKKAWQNIAGSSYDATQAGTRPNLPEKRLPGGKPRAGAAGLRSITAGP